MQNSTSGEIKDVIYAKAETMSAGTPWGTWALNLICLKNIINTMKMIFLLEIKKDFV